MDEQPDRARALARMEELYLSILTDSEAVKNVCKVSRMGGRALGTIHGPAGSGAPFMLPPLDVRVPLGPPSRLDAYGSAKPSDTSTVSGGDPMPIAGTTKYSGANVKRT